MIKMKKFLENYALIALLAIVIIVLIIIASPFGVSVENGIKSLVGSFSNRVNDSTKHITVTGGESEQEDDRHRYWLMDRHLIVN